MSHNASVFCQDVDNHSVTSSVGSDTISSVSQDGNRLSVATSGYSSDPSRSNKISISGEHLQVHVRVSGEHLLFPVGVSGEHLLFPVRVSRNWIG